MSDPIFKILSLNEDNQNKDPYILPFHLYPPQEFMEWKVEKDFPFQIGLGGLIAVEKDGKVIAIQPDPWGNEHLDQIYKVFGFKGLDGSRMTCRNFGQECIILTLLFKDCK